MGIAHRHPAFLRGLQGALVLLLGSSARVHSAGWQPPLEMTPSSIDARNPAVAINAQHQGLAVWNQSVAGQSPELLTYPPVLMSGSASSVGRS
jgi:hypothetical protein